MSEIIKLFNWRKFDYELKKEKELLENKHIRIIEQSLEGTNSKKFGGVLKVTNWELVKYIFLFQNCIGCRIGDIPHFKVSNMNFDKKSQLLSWTQQKTDKRVTIPVLEKTKEIIRDGLPYKISIQKFNKHIKEICRIAEISEMINDSKITVTEIGKGNKEKRKVSGTYPK